MERGDKLAAARYEARIAEKVCLAKIRPLTLTLHLILTVKLIDH